MRKVLEFLFPPAIQIWATVCLGSLFLMWIFGKSVGIL